MSAITVSIAVMCYARCVKSKTLILLEEIFNAAVHGIGFLAVIAGLIIFFQNNHAPYSLSKIMGIIVFGLSLLILYSMSTMYHSLIYTRAKNFFRIMDHSAVYILIAGTYTPLLIALKTTHGWVLLGMIWALAVLGVVYKSIFKTSEGVMSTIYYLLMGWLIVLAIKPLFHVIHLPTFLLLLTGGISYTVGTIFFALKKTPFNHVVWHLFVIIGSTSHFLAICTL